MEDIKKLKKNQLIDLCIEQQETLELLMEEIEEYKKELNEIRNKNKEIIESRVDKEFDKRTMEKIKYLEKRYEDTRDKKYLTQKQKIIDNY